MFEHHCLLKWSLISKTQKIQRYFLADTIQKATVRKSNVPVKSRNEFRWEHWVSLIGVMREKVTRNIVNWNKHPPDCKGSLHNWATFVAARKDFEKGDELYRERERNNLSFRIRFEAWKLLVQLLNPDALPNELQRLLCRAVAYIRFARVENKCFFCEYYSDLQKGLLQPHMIVAFFESLTLTFIMYLLCIPERALDPERKRNLLLYQLC